MLWLSCHSPSTRAYTLAVASGPILTGLPSDTSTVLEQPSIKARTSTTQTIQIQSSIDRHGATLHATGEVVEECDGDLGDDPVEHVT